jgi:hypothetical protein
MLKAIRYSILVFIISSFSPVKNDNIEAYQITQIMPDINMAGGIHRYDTSTAQVFYFKDLIIYKLNYTHTITDNGVVTVKDEKRSHYILFKKSERYGFDFDEHKTPVKRRVLIDSVFSGEWTKQNDLYPMFTAYKTRLLNSQRKGNSLIENYRMWDKKDSMKVLDCRLKFTTSMKNIELSICKQLDSTSNRKLYEMSFAGNPEYYKRFGITSGIYYSHYLIEKLKTFNNEYLMKLVASYE